MFVLKGVNYRLLSADRKETYAKHLCPGICSGTGRACLHGSGQPAQPARPAQRPVIDWEKQKAEILEHYRTLVQIDTTYGNETKVVEYLKKVLDGEGIPSKTFAKDPNRANLVARLKGNEIGRAHV